MRGSTHSLAPSDGEKVRVTGSTNASAAALVTLHTLSAQPNRPAAQWLLAQRHAQGGFVAAPGAPLPDLLSTATTLHALAVSQVSLEPLHEACLDFIDSLWSNTGGFHGHWLDETLDAEYTFYGLLALGHLAKKEVRATDAKEVGVGEPR